MLLDWLKTGKAGHSRKIIYNRWVIDKHLPSSVLDEQTILTLTTGSSFPEPILKGASAQFHLDVQDMGWLYLQESKEGKKMQSKSRLHKANKGEAQQIKMRQD